MQTQTGNLLKTKFLMSSMVLASALALMLPSESSALTAEEFSDEELQEIEEYGELNEVIQAVASANTAAAVTRTGIGSSGQVATTATASAPAAVPTTSTPTVQSPGSSVAVVPVKAIYVYENQPVQIVDSQGRLIQVIYLVRKKQ